MPRVAADGSFATHNQKGAELMTAGYQVRKTAQTLAGKPVFAVHVLRDDGNGGTEMVRIPCPDTAEQDRIAAELAELLNELLPNR